MVQKAVHKILKRCEQGCQRSLRSSGSLRSFWKKRATPAGLRWERQEARQIRGPPQQESLTFTWDSFQQCNFTTNSIMFRSLLSKPSLKRQNHVIATQTQEPGHSAKYVAFRSFNHRDSSVRLDSVSPKSWVVWAPCLLSDLGLEHRLMAFKAEVLFVFNCGKIYTKSGLSL